MSVSKLTRILVATTSLLFASAACAATLTVNGSGQLTGAQGVNVGGTLYDVTFVDGTCTALFGGCDDASDFTFTDTTSGAAAAQALLDQVFIDGLAGQFDSNPQLTNGCTSTSACLAYIPGRVSGSTVFGAVAWNASGSGDGPSTFATPTTNDLGQATNETYAVFTRAAVPEPSTWALMLLGFGGIGAALRRRKRSRAQLA